MMLELVLLEGKLDPRVAQVSCICMPLRLACPYLPPDPAKRALHTCDSTLLGPRLVDLSWPNCTCSCSGARSTVLYRPAWRV